MANATDEWVIAHFSDYAIAAEFSYYVYGDTIDSDYRDAVSNEAEYAENPWEGPFTPYNYGGYFGSLGWTTLTHPNGVLESYMSDGTYHMSRGLYAGDYDSWTPGDDLRYEVEAVAVQREIDGEQVVVLAFRGTDDEVAGGTSGQAYIEGEMRAYYEGLKPIIDGIIGYMNAGNADRLIITGHSLGGGMVDMFMIEDADRLNDPSSLTAVPIASPGVADGISVSGVDTSNYVRINHTLDPVPYPSFSLDATIWLGLKNNQYLSGRVIKFELPNIEDGRDEHSMELYLEHIQLLANDPLGPNGTLTSSFSLPSNPIIIGNSGDVTEVSDPAHDRGDASLIGDDNADYILGNQGDDSLDGNGGHDRLSGGGGQDTITGGAGNDWIHGGGGRDTMHGNSGNDRMWGATGDDLFYGNTGNDEIYGDSGKDTLSGNEDDDRLYGGSGDDSLMGGDGNDSIWGGTENDYLSGGRGDDVLAGEEGDDSILGGSGYDDLDGRDGNDTIHGEEEADTIRGGSGNDQIYGGDDVDWLYGQQDDDTILGQEGDDVLEGNEGFDSLLGGNGNDTIDGHDDNDTLEGGAGNDSLSGGAGDDSLIGDSGDDWMEGGAGGDFFDGGEGLDTVSYLSATRSVRVDLQNAALMYNDAVGDTFLNVEVFRTGDYSDQLRGDASGNTFYTGGLSDRLYGRAGNDRLFGEAGADAFYGGAGADVMTGGDDAGRRDRFIYFNMVESGVGEKARDVITDFVSGEDRIEISRFDANLGLGGKQGFTFIADAGLSGIAGELGYRHEGSNTIVEADVNGDGLADFEIQLTGLMDLTVDDFLL